MCCIPVRKPSVPNFNVFFYSLYSSILMHNIACGCVCKYNSCFNNSYNYIEHKLLLVFQALVIHKNMSFLGSKCFWGHLWLLYFYGQILLIHPWICTIKLWHNTVDTQCTFSISYVVTFYAMSAEDERTCSYIQTAHKYRFLSSQKWGTKEKRHISLKYVHASSITVS